MPHAARSDGSPRLLSEPACSFFSQSCNSSTSCAFIVMPGGLGTLDELFEAATLIQCKKIGPFPSVLMGAKFWKGLKTWGRHLMKHGVFEQEELGFGRITDSPREAVELIVRSMPVQLRKILKPPQPLKGLT
jgi:predicted Rossmann-fold nucleotide-binding protein